MDDEEIYMFDTQGYVILRNVLTKNDLATLNAAVDRHADEIGWFEYLLSPMNGFVMTFCAIYYHRRSMPALTGAGTFILTARHDGRRPKEVSLSLGQWVIRLAKTLTTC